jgi:bifunctional non-homologous end joining protein LigD
MPSVIAPQLATLARRAPGHGNWSYEIKFDGYRMLSRVEHGAARLITRNGYDWTDRLPKLRDALESLAVDTAWLDGEAVVLNADGMPDFNALQNAFDRRSTSKIVLFVFDLLYLNGEDIREQPLRVRREALKTLMDEVDGHLLRFSRDFPQDPATLLESARAMKLEGIIEKRGDAPYRSGRSTDWIKLKCEQRQGFVIGGLAGGSFLLGVYEDDGSLRYVGDVEAHLSPHQRAALQARIKPVAEPPFKKTPKRSAIWIQPEIIAQVRFLEWTRNGRIRHSVFEKVIDAPLGRAD